MKNIYHIFCKEIRHYFFSPIAYVVIFIFLAISGFMFYNLLLYFNLASLQYSRYPFLLKELNLTNMVIRPLFHNLSVVMLLLLPALTMRLFSEEKKLGTIELLFTTPVRRIEIVIGKYLACIFLFMIMISLTFFYFVIMAFYTNVDFGAVLSGYLGLLLLGGAFCSIGILTSSLTENQIIAAVLSFGILLIFWLLSWVSSENLKFIEYLSILPHFEDMSKGVIDTKDIVYYLSFIFFFLFLTLRNIEEK